MGFVIVLAIVMFLNMTQLGMNLGKQINKVDALLHRFYRRDKT